MNIPFNRQDESNDFYRDPRKSDKDYHWTSDVDSSHIAKHHTLGAKRNQASPGDHRHTGIDGSVLAGGSVVKGQLWNGAGSTDVSSNSATFVEHSSFSILNVPLLSGNVYHYKALFSWFKTSSTNLLRMTTRISQNTTTGTLYGASYFIFWNLDDVATGSSQVTTVDFYWYQATTSTDNIIFNFNRDSGTGAESCTVRADPGRGIAYVECLGKLGNEWSYKT